MLPAYNVEPYIEAAVQSLLDQTFRDFELLVMDDGSVDRTASILEELARRDARVKLTVVSHVGYVPLLNRMVQAAKGDLLARMDADDIALPERFEKQVHFLDSHPEVVAVGGQAIYIDPKGRELGPCDRLLDHDAIEAAYLGRAGGAMLHPTVMMRAQTARQIGGYNPSYSSAEDLDFFLRMTEVGRVANLPDVVLKYRVHLKSVSHTRQAEQLETQYRILKEAHHRRGIEMKDGPGSNKPPRPASTERFLRRWAKLALASGRFDLARKYAFASLVRKPWSIRTLSVLLKAMLAPMSRSGRM